MRTLSSVFALFLFASPFAHSQQTQQPAQVARPAGTQVAQAPAAAAVPAAAATAPAAAAGFGPVLAGFGAAVAGVAASGMSSSSAVSH